MMILIAVGEAGARHLGAFDEQLTRSSYTECPARYRTRHFLNNSNINEDIATKFEQEYVLFFHISYTMR